MRRTLFAAAVAAGSLALTTGRAAAQYGNFPQAYPNPYQQAGYGQQFPGGFGQQYQGGYAPQYQSGYGPQFQPGFGQPVGGPDVAFVQSLYSQYLGRQPDPRGLNTWVNRLAQFGGDTNRLTQEFIQSSQRELNANNPHYPRGGRWR